MNIQDLRVGDFVYQEDKIGKILAIGPEQISICIGKKYKYVYISDIQPIPITDELLEKMGFDNTIRVDKSRCYKFASNKNTIYIWHTYKMNKYSIMTLDNTSSMIGEKRVSYLHQLQHELYDAEIDIKIELE